MKKKKLLLPILIGSMIGQLFAEGERPFSVANTVRFGYNDNLYRNDNDKSSFYVTDIVDLAFRAAFSERTDMTVKSQLTLLDDDGGSEIYPNLYAMLNHSVSPKMLLRLSEYYRSGEKSGSGTVAAKNERYNYYENRVKGSADYILNEKNRLETSVGHSILRNEDDKKSGLNLDYTTVDAGTSWKHDIAPQRTYSVVNLRERWTEYENRDSSYDATEISAGLGHTFNKEWQGNIEAGVTHVRPDEKGAENENTINPLISAGLTYSPSPRTRLSGNFTSRYEESGDNRYGGQTSHELLFGAQHDLTAKLMAKATARFSRVEYDENASANKSTEEDRMDLEFRLTYKLNRINFLEAGVKHSAVDRDTGDDWEQNMVDVGWRVELN